MEFFDKAIAVRLKSHLDKYLVATDDRHTVKQSRTASTTPEARWLVEHVDSNNNIIRLKSCYNTYLTACSTQVLLGTTGNKVLQNSCDNVATEWQPVRDGFQFKFKSYVGTYLRANGGVRPWRNTVTHDGSFTSSMNNWVLWDVEAVDVVEDESFGNCLSIVPSFVAGSGEVSGREVRSPVAGRVSGFSGPNTAQLVKKVKMFRGRMSVTNTQFQAKFTKFTSYAYHTLSHKIPHLRLNFPTKLIKNNHLIQQESEPPAMDLLRHAKVVRLRSHHGKYLYAKNDQESVSQDRHGTAINAHWTIEFVEDTPDDIIIIRLKSCYDKYLTASDNPFLFGLTGKKVIQSVPLRLDSSVEWEPIREGKQVKLKTRYGHYLRGNGGLPPWRNSVTHDIPQHAATQDWIMWQIDVVNTNEQSLQLVPYSDSFTSSSASPTISNHELIDSPLKREEGRAIHYRVISDNFGELDENGQGFCVSFKGTEVNELTRMLEEETRLHNITVCSQSPLDGKLYPLRLQLPPNNVTMKVVVVKNSSEGEKQYRFKVRSSSKSSYGGYF